MIRHGLVCLLFGGLAWGQAAGPAAAQTQSSTSYAADAAAGAASPEVPADAPVITLKGVCASQTASAGNCVSVVTRAEFESLVAAVQSTMPAAARRRFASQYANLIEMSEKAHEAGLDQGEEFGQHMKIARLSIISEALTRALRDGTQISRKDIEDYYQKNIAAYQEADLQRMFIPRVQQLPPTKEKLTEYEVAARKKQSEETMKAEADRLRLRALAGESFNKLQDEAFELAGIHAGPSNPSMSKIRASSFPPNQAFVMDLKPGEVSTIIEDLSGYVIYRMGEKTTEPLPQVQDDIRNTLIAERVQGQIQSMLDAANLVFNDRYFGPPDSH